MSRLLSSPLWLFPQKCAPRGSTRTCYSGHGLAPGATDNHSWIGNRLSQRQEIAGKTKLSYADYTISSNYGWWCWKGQKHCNDGAWQRPLNGQRVLTDTPPPSDSLNKKLLLLNGHKEFCLTHRTRLPRVWSWLEFKWCSLLWQPARAFHDRRPSCLGRCKYNLEGGSQEHCPGPVTLADDSLLGS